MTRLALAGLAVALACTSAAAADRTSTRSIDAYPSTYRPIVEAPTLIRGATVLTGTGERLDGADVLIEDGRIAGVGSGLRAPPGAREIDGSGKWVTPGLIDVHSHLGVYPSPGVRAHSDGNEMIAPNTSQVWAEHAVWPQDPGFATALAGGVTTLQILPGSANLIGGRGVTLRNVPALTYQAMKFPDAPHGLKMACGENPKRVYGGRNQAPMTRMGNMAGYRAAFAQAAEYRRAWDRHDGNSRGGGEPPKRDLQMDTLAAAMDGDILVHVHCYRADEMANMLDLANEFGFRIAAFHHGVEAYKLADRLGEEGVCGALWADWWGFKMEAYDGIQENIAIVDRAPGGCAIVHSDSDEGIQRLNQEAAKVMGRAERLGMPIPPERAITWLTSNAARSLGVADRTGTLEPGKMGDVVLWDRNPFSVYAHAEKVFVDGALLYDRHDPARQPVSDFILGQEGIR
ncbi:amidohydrolase [Coralloluteibacterium thermophilus]|uniref:Amidohydrolase n=1 Tax=Coralloluteibacterium thermophilum TaxID=2707049 RepID=A0ABV9NMA0_9GAMM